MCHCDANSDHFVAVNTDW